ncbi:MAG TPA: amidohydrolase family protein [Blastocatellia bacterium]|nr:amidohydrolase family protein [Blastocatellia bacterium]
MKAYVKAAALLVFALLFVTRGVSAQERAQDKKGWLKPETTVTDDPRRVPVPPTPRGFNGTLVVTGGRIFDGTGAPARAGSVVIKGNHIAAMLPEGSKDWPSDATVINVGGKTVMPGLIDMHTHITYTEPGLPADVATSLSDATLRGAERLRFYLESGITSIRDVASTGDAPFRLKAWVNEGRIPGPRVFAAGQLITGIGGHAAETLSPSSPLFGSVREATGPDEWRQAVREQFKRGADVIKIASHFSRDEVKAAIEEAHALGLRVTCDCETFYIQWAVEAGIDCIEHPLPRTEQTIKLMADKGVYSVPTQIPYIYIFDLSGGYYDTTSRRFSFSEAANLELVKKMKAAGIKMGVGTDLVSNWFRYLPAPYISELKQFVKTGYSNSEALVAATRTNSEILDMSDKLGTLEPGKLADLIVVDGQPDANLDDLAKIDIVIRDGLVAVKDGQVVIPRHRPAAPPDVKGTADPSKRPFPK